MKRFFYSNVTKSIAVILFLASLVLGVLSVAKAAVDYEAEGMSLYMLEGHFEDTDRFSYFLEAPERAVFDAYGFASQGSDTQRLGNLIGLRLQGMDGRDVIDYYVKWDNVVYKNCSASSPADLMSGSFYRYYSIDQNGNLDFRSDPQPYRSIYAMDYITLYPEYIPLTICTRIQEDYLAECEEIWLRQEQYVQEGFTSGLLFALLSTILLIYLLCVCGKDKDGNPKRSWLDLIWTELHLGAIICFLGGAIWLCTAVMEECFRGNFPANMAYSLFAAAAVLAGSVFLASLLSIVRNLKHRRLIGATLTLCLLRWLWNLLCRIAKWLYAKVRRFCCMLTKAMSKRSGILLLLLLLVYSVVITFLTLLAEESREAGFFLLLLFPLGAAGFVISYRSMDLDSVKKGASEIRSGNLSYEIPALRSTDLNVLAKDINDIAEGLEESVSAKLRSERMKTELITNVSHDLKTPLTSIINYTELLSKVEGLPEEARDYAQIIAGKSDRLKKLTQDLFDISKVQSGNEEAVFERLDVALLIEQALAEHDKEIQASELPFCVNTEKELFISADGAKLSRALSNLIQNILKYSMKHTRVFITAARKNDTVMIELKNISAYPMDFTAEEIVGRFVRADSSRSTEGNGLGLAIAKSYTELCKGRFEILLDGDLFKALLYFPSQP